jgi:hypothetical protein
MEGVVLSVRLTSAEIVLSQIIDITQSSLL